MAAALRSVLRGVLALLYEGTSAGDPSPSGIAWDPTLSDANVAFTNSDRTVEVASPPGAGQAYYYVRTASVHSSGKYYFEIVIEATSNGIVGAIGDQYGIAVGVIKDSKAISTIADTDFPGQNNFSAIADGSSSWRWNSGSGGLFSIDWDQTGERLGIAIDLSAGKMWFRDTSGYNTGDPATDTNPSITGLTTSIDWALMCMVGANAGDSVKSKLTGVFASADWVFGAPSGFSQW